MPKAFPPLSWEEFKSIMKEFGFRLQYSESGSSHHFFVNEKFKVIGVETVRVAKPHGKRRGHTMIMNDIKETIRKLGVTKEYFYGKAGKQIPGKKKKK